MARTMIVKKDGTPTEFFWLDTDGSEPTRKTVYKETKDGLKRMKTVRFNVGKNEFHRE
ncbi:MAG: hypothetical protein ACRENP_26050 [Longimicrobiales bacterium]